MFHLLTRSFRRVWSDESGRLMELYIIPAVLAMLAAVLIPQFTKGGLRHGLAATASLVLILGAGGGAFLGLFYVLERSPRLLRWFTAVVATLWYGLISFIFLALMMAAAFSFLTIGPAAQDRVLAAIGVFSLILGGLVHSERIPGLKWTLTTLLMATIGCAGFFFVLFFVTMLVLSTDSQGTLWTITGLELAVSAGASLWIVIRARTRA